MCQPYPCFADIGTNTITSPVWDTAALCLSLWPAANSTQMLTLVSTTVSYTKAYMTQHSDPSMPCAWVGHMCNSQQLHQNTLLIPVSEKLLTSPALYIAALYLSCGQHRNCFRCYDLSQTQSEQLNPISWQQSLPFVHFARHCIMTHSACLLYVYHSLWFQAFYHVTLGDCHTCIRLHRHMSTNVCTYVCLLSWANR